MRKIVFLVGLFLIWNFSYIIIPDDVAFLTTLRGYSFLPMNVYNSLWLISTFLFCYSFYKLLISYDLNSNYNFIVILNYVFSQFFRFCFYGYHSIIISLISLCVMVVSSLFLFIETKKIDKGISYLTILYFLINVLSLINMMVIFLLN